MTRTRFLARRAAVAFVTALSMAITPAAPIWAATPQATGAAKPQAPAAAPAAPGKPPASAAAAPAKAPAPAATPTPPADGGWPRAYETPSQGRILVYQPQVASWTDQKHMTAYSAVSYESKGTAKPALGSIRLDADTKVAVSERLVNFSSLKISEANFPTLKKEEVRGVTDEIDESIPSRERVIGLDRVLASVDKSQILPKNIEGVKSDPPKIFFSDTPAVLVNLDGDVIWSPIKENDLKFAVNTNWDLFLHDPTKVLYLRNEKSWLQAKDVNGPWTPVDKLPDSFKKLPADDNWKDVKEAVPGKKLDKDKVPKVFVTTTPAEMILLNGPAVYKP